MKNKSITDQTPVSISELAAHFGVCRSTVYRSIAEGYRMEFPSIRRTTVGHFKIWLREQPAPGQSSAAEERRLAEEIRRLKL